MSMKKIVIALLIVLLIGTSAFAQTTQPTFTALQNGFKTFSDAFTNTLPFNAVATGLNWSDAYIGQLFALPPHFGAGITVGAATIPTPIISDLLNTFGVDLNSALSSLGNFGPIIRQVGIPIPAYTFDARVGGFFFPFDMGFKIGFIPQEVKSLMLQNNLPFNVDYLMIGGDFRLAPIHSPFFNLSTGLGFTWYKGGVGVLGLMPGDITLATLTDPTTNQSHTLALKNPSFQFDWETFVIDLKVQASLNLLIITPYIGAGASFGAYSKAGGGLLTELLYDGQPADKAAVDNLISLLKALGEDIPDISAEGIIISSEARPSWAFRAYGGLSVNLFILKVDAQVLYNMTSQSFGAAVGMRIQI